MVCPGAAPRELGFRCWLPLFGPPCRAALLTHDTGNSWEVSLPLLLDFSRGVPSTVESSKGNLLLSWDCLSLKRRLLCDTSPADGSGIINQWGSGIINQAVLP